MSTLIEMGRFKRGDEDWHGAWIRGEALPDYRQGPCSEPPPDSRARGSKLGWRAKWVQRATSGTLSTASWGQRWRQVRSKLTPQYFIGRSSSGRRRYWDDSDYVDYLGPAESLPSKDGFPNGRVKVRKDSYASKEKKSPWPVWPYCVVVLVLLLLAVVLISLLLQRVLPYDSPTVELVGKVTSKLTLVSLAFQKDMKNTSSAAFKRLSDTFCSEIGFLYNSSQYGERYRGCYVQRAERGSVIVTYEMTFSAERGQLISYEQLRDVLDTVDLDKNDSSLGLLGNIVFRMSSVEFVRSRVVFSKKITSKVTLLSTSTTKTPPTTTSSTPTDVDNTAPIDSEKGRTDDVDSSRNKPSAASEGNETMTKNKLAQFGKSMTDSSPVNSHPTTSMIPVTKNQNGGKDEEEVETSIENEHTATLTDLRKTQAKSFDPSTVSEQSEEVRDELQSEPELETSTRTNNSPTAVEMPTMSDIKLTFLNTSEHARNDTHSRTSVSKTEATGVLPTTGSMPTVTTVASSGFRNSEITNDVEENWQTASNTYLTATTSASYQEAQPIPDVFDTSTQPGLIDAPNMELSSQSPFGVVLQSEDSGAAWDQVSTLATHPPAFSHTGPQTDGHWVDSQMSNDFAQSEGSMTESLPTLPSYDDYYQQSLITETHTPGQDVIHFGGTTSGILHFAEEGTGTPALQLLAKSTPPFTTSIYPGRHRTDSELSKAHDGARLDTVDGPEQSTSATHVKSSDRETTAMKNVETNSLPPFLDFYPTTIAVRTLEMPFEVPPMHLFEPLPDNTGGPGETKTNAQSPEGHSNIQAKLWNSQEMSTEQYTTGVTTDALSPWGQNTDQHVPRFVNPESEFEGQETPTTSNKDTAPTAETGEQLDEPEGTSHSFGAFESHTTGSNAGQDANSGNKANNTTKSPLETRAHFDESETMSDGFGPFNIYTTESIYGQDEGSAENTHNVNNIEAESPWETGMQPGESGAVEQQVPATTETFSNLRGAWETQQGDKSFDNHLEREPESDRLKTASDVQGPTGFGTTESLYGSPLDGQANQDNGIFHSSSPDETQPARAETESFWFGQKDFYTTESPYNSPTKENTVPENEMISNPAEKVQPFDELKDEPVGVGQEFEAAETFRDGLAGDATHQADNVFTKFATVESAPDQMLTDHGSQVFDTTGSLFDGLFKDKTPNDIEIFKNQAGWPHHDVLETGTVAFAPQAIDQTELLDGGRYDGNIPPTNAVFKTPGAKTADVVSQGSMPRSHEEDDEWNTDTTVDASREPGFDTVSARPETWTPRSRTWAPKTTHPLRNFFAKPPLDVLPDNPITTQSPLNRWEPVRNTKSYETTDATMQLDPMIGKDFYLPPIPAEVPIPLFAGFLTETSSWETANEVWNKDTGITTEPLFTKAMTTVRSTTMMSTTTPEPTSSEKPSTKPLASYAKYNDDMTQSDALRDWISPTESTDQGNVDSRAKAGSSYTKDVASSVNQRINIGLFYSQKKSPVMPRPILTTPRPLPVPSIVAYQNVRRAKLCMPARLTWHVYGVPGWTVTIVARKPFSGSTELIGLVSSRRQSVTAGRSKLVVSSHSQFQYDSITLVVDIPYTTCKDEGKYYIRVNNGRGTMAQKIDEFFVFGEPKAKLRLPPCLLEGQEALDAKCEADLGYPQGSVIWRVRRRNETVFTTYQCNSTSSNVTVSESCKANGTFTLPSSFLLDMSWNLASVQCAVVNSSAITSPSGMVVSNTEVLQILPKEICEGARKLRIPHPYDRCSRYVSCYQGEPSVLNCPSGTCFNTFTTSCMPYREHSIMADPFFAGTNRLTKSIT